MSEGPPTIKSMLAILMDVASLTLAAIALLSASQSHNTDDLRHLEQRLCRLEAHDKVGDCGH